MLLERMMASPKEDSFIISSRAKSSNIPIRRNLCNKLSERHGKFQTLNVLETKLGCGIEEPRDVTCSPRKTQRSAIKESMSSPPPQLSPAEERFVGTQLNQKSLSKEQSNLAKTVSKELRLSSVSLPNRSSSCNVGKSIRKSASTHLKSRSKSVASNDRKTERDVFEEKVERVSQTVDAYFSDDDQNTSFSQSINVVSEILSLNKSNSDTNLADAEDFHKQSSHNLIQSRKTIWSLSSLTIKNGELPIKTPPEKGSGDFARNATRTVWGPILSARVKKVPKSRLPRRVQSYCHKAASKVKLDDTRQSASFRNNRSRGRAQSAFYLDECQTYLRKKAVEQHKKFQCLHSLVMRELELLSYELSSKNAESTQGTGFIN